MSVVGGYAPEAKHPITSLTKGTGHSGGAAVGIVPGGVCGAGAGGKGLSVPSHPHAPPPAAHGVKRKVRAAKPHNHLPSAHGRWWKNQRVAATS